MILKPAVSFLLTATAALCAASAGEVKFVAAPAMKRSGGKTLISFALNAKTDVEVAVLDAKGKVIRHLAAGVLGGENPPPAPLKPGLSQSLEWDGKDDYGQPAADPDAFTARVRAGMGVSLERIVGGDPYAFYSREMGQGDHAAWKITGLDVKPDGSVYVMGNASNYGPPAIRQYSADGAYQRTVYPPQAGKPVEEMKGWGVNVRADGTYSPGYSDLSSPALSRTLIAGTRGECAFLLPTPEKDQLLLVNRRSRPFQLLRIKTDGTIPPDTASPGQLVDEPSLIHPEQNGWKVPWRVKGPAFTAFSPDGKRFYLSGLYATTQKLAREVGAEQTGFWRDGQVWRVDVATRQATVFFALDEKQVITDRDARVKSPIANVWYCDYGYAAFHGIAVDAEGNVLVGDRQNKRVVALDKAGKVIREFPVMHADALALLPGTKTLYVTTRARDHHSKGEVRLLKFNDWAKDTEPAASVLVCPSYGYSPNTFLGVARNNGENLIWVAYTPLPVRIYKDKGTAFELAKDFYEAGPQRALDLQHIVADPATEHVYVSDGWGNCFRVTDWRNPQFVRCMQDAKRPLRALSLASRKGLVDFMNYEACVGYFPVVFRPRFQPFVHIGRKGEFGTEGPNVDFLTYPERTGGRVDYVLVWGAPREVHDPEAAASVRRQLDAAYDLVFTSRPRGLMRLYRRKPAGTAPGL